MASFSTYSRFFREITKFVSRLRHLPIFFQHYRLVHVVLYVIFGWYYDILKTWEFWDETLLLFTFLTGKLRKNLFWTNKKFVYTYYHNKFLSKNNAQKYYLDDMKRFYDFFPLAKSRNCSLWCFMEPIRNIDFFVMIDPEYR